ncbi:MAG: hypothetical protein GQ564_01790 [Bacteroidales bacterium]|nr:hypothetical protein [Bacteroidales bacterium]
MSTKLFLLFICVLLSSNALLSQNNTERKKTAEQLSQEKKTQELSVIEKETVRIIDSISKAEKLERFEVLTKGNIPVEWFNLPLNKLIDYNNYEGFRLGLGIMTNERFSNYFSVGGYFGYGFKDKDWKYGGDLILILHKESESKLHFSYMNDVIEKSAYSFLEILDFSTSEIYRSLMIKDMDLIKKYQVEYNALIFEYFRFNVYLNQSYVKATDDYSFGSTIASSTNNFSFNEIGIQFRYAYKEKFKQTTKTKYSLGTNYPILFGNLSKGTNWIDGEYEYTKIEAKITKTFKTKTFGKTKLALVGGLTKGNVPISKLYNGHGSHGSFSFEAENSFGTMRMGEFYSDRFFYVFLKHDFGSLIFNSEIFNPEFIVVNNFGIGELSQNTNHQTTAPIQSIEKGYYESGLLINNILNSSFSGIGFGLFYRYGSYSFTNTADNFSYKLTLTIGL